MGKFNLKKEYHMAEMPQFGDFCWNELATADVKGAKDFYGKVFGWEFVEHDMGDMVYTMIKLKGKDLAAGIWAIPKDKQKQIPPHWMSYIIVEALDKAVEKATKHGAQVMKPPTNAGDFGRFAVITDPTGAHIALWQTLKSK
jgi:predicted enzyme related to lactoylglutathione lyase